MRELLPNMIAYLHVLALLREGGTNCNREINELMNMINAELFGATE